MAFEPPAGTTVLNVTTLIPAYKTQYLTELFVSLQAQTRLPARIIVSDDSPGGVFRRTLQSEPMRGLIAGLPLELHQGPCCGGALNTKQLVRLWNGGTELFHILFDDDVIYPDFYQRHLAAHEAGQFSCTVSRRWTANDRGQPILSKRMPEVVENHPHRMITVSEQVAFATTVPAYMNWFGEFTNAVFGPAVGELLLARQRLHDIPYAGLEDLGTFLAASATAPLCFIQEHLGCFRMSAHQSTSQALSPEMKANALAWFALGIAGRRSGQLSEEQMHEGFQRAEPLFTSRYAAEADMAPFREVLPALIAGDRAAEERFLQAWQGFAATLKKE